MRPASGAGVAHSMEDELILNVLDRIIAVGTEHLRQCKHWLCTSARRGKRHRPKPMERM